MQVLLLNEADEKKVVSMKDTIGILEKAFAEFASGGVNMPLRPVINVPEHDGMAGFMPAYLPKMGALAVKTVCVFRNNAQRGLPSIHGVVSLIDNETGVILSVMNGGYLTALRTGAASGVATKYMAREDAHVAAIFGAGVQGRTQLEAICEVRDIRVAYVYDVVKGQAERFVQEMSKLGGKMPKDFRIAASPSEALKEADIICTTTTAKTPIFDGAELKPGVHINGVGSHAPAMRELDTTTVTRSKIVCDSVAACLAEAGDLLIPIQEGRLKKEDLRGDLGDAVLGKLRGRQSKDEITLFKSVGLALEDASTALAIYRQACERGIGSKFEL